MKKAKENWPDPEVNYFSDRYFASVGSVSDGFTLSNSSGMPGFISRTRGAIDQYLHIDDLQGAASGINAEDPAKSDYHFDLTGYGQKE